jgi:IclR family pca regulon transcriptional regulator
MGRVLLAALPEEELDKYLGRAVFQRLTSRTVATAAALRTELAKVRGQGWALVDQELEDGLRSLAAPVRNRAGRVVGAVNLSAHASRTSLESLRRDLLPHLLAATGRIDADLRAVTATRR